MDWKYILTSYDGRINRAKFWAAIGVFIAIGVLQLPLQTVVLIGIPLSLVITYFLRMRGPA